MRRRPWERVRVGVPVMGIILLTVGICVIALAYGKYWIGQEEAFNKWMELETKSYEFDDAAERSTIGSERDSLQAIGRDLRKEGWDMASRSDELRNRFWVALIIGVVLILTGTIHLVVRVRKRRNY